MQNFYIRNEDLLNNPELYYGKQHWASNMYRSLFVYEGVAFLWAEQAFQWAKAMTFNDFKTAKAILEVDNPFDAKRLGGSCKGFKEKKWISVRDSIMKTIVYCKFTCSRELYYKLMASPLLIEASPTDSYWGTGCTPEETLAAIEVAKEVANNNPAHNHSNEALRLGQMAHIYMETKRNVSVLGDYENYLDKIGYVLSTKEKIFNVNVHRMQMDEPCMIGTRNWMAMSQSHNCKSVMAKRSVECYEPPKYLSEAIPGGKVYVVNDMSTNFIAIRNRSSGDFTYALLRADSIVLPWQAVNMELEAIAEEMQRAGTASNFESYIEMTSPRS